MAGGVAVLSGAGLSTESGIPDYRGPTGRVRTATPMTYQEFVGSAAAQRRYWARSHLGWRQVARAVPNPGHRAVADLQRAGLVTGVITQNVDGLHDAAGAREVIDLHGRLDRVVCLDCDARTTRDALDVRLSERNPDWRGAVVEVKPDGDATLRDDAIEEFSYVGCADCGGRLKPDVVFFGENVPKPRVAASYDVVERARAMLVLGSSLTVASGYRFVRHAARLGQPVAIINQGATRADAIADLLIAAPLGATLAAVAAAAAVPRTAGLVTS